MCGQAVEGGYVCFCEVACESEVVCVLCLLILCAFERKSERVRERKSKCVLRVCSFVCVREIEIVSVCL